MYQSSTGGILKSPTCSAFKWYLGHGLICRRSPPLNVDTSECPVPAATTPLSALGLRGEFLPCPAPGPGAPVPGVVTDRQSRVCLLPAQKPRWHHQATENVWVRDKGSDPFNYITRAEIKDAWQQPIISICHPICDS